jgi:hypothetical protein
MIVTTVGGKSYEGVLFAIDPRSKALALKTEQDSYVIISPSQITNIIGDLNATQTPEIQSLGINPKTIEKRQETYLKQAQKCIDALNSNVTEETQSLFDKINFVMPCTWEGNSFIVLEEYRIDPPYDKVTVMKDSDGTGIDRVEKVLEGERKKLKL